MSGHTESFSVPLTTGVTFPQAPSFICAHHFPIHITYIIPAYTGRSFMGGEVECPEREEVWQTVHYSDRFTRDDITNQDVLKSAKSIRVLPEVRRYFSLEKVRAEARNDKLIVPHGDEHDYLAGFAANIVAALCYVGANDRDGLFLPWEPQHLSIASAEAKS